jgi:hypothetical protein
LASPLGGGTHHACPFNPVFPGPNLGQFFPRTTQAGPSNPIFPSRNLGQRFPGTVNPTWSQPIRMGISPEGGMPTTHVNNDYMSQHPQQKPAMGSIYNAPLQDAYGPTGIPTGLSPQSYQYPEVNQQFPFLATLDLPDLSRLMNDPI